MVIQMFEYNVHTITVAVHRETCINKNRNNSLSIYTDYIMFSVHIGADRVFASLDYTERDAVPVLSSSY